MKNLLKSIIFIVIALFIVDRIGGKIMWWVNQNTQDIYGSKIKYLADNVNEDLVLIGTSKCNYHYVPSILSDSLNMTVYNGGIDGSNCIYSQYFILNQVLRHHTPKVICLDITVNDYEVVDNSFDVTSFFAPYIGRSEYADSVFRDAGSYWAYRLSHLYRYNAKATSNLAGLFINYQRNSDNGYIPLLQPEYFPEKLEKAYVPDGIDSLKLSYIQRFINRCRDNNIKLVFMISPVYTIAQEDMYKPLKDIADKNGIPLLDYHTKGLFVDHPEYFRDTWHLWDKGAQLYTSMFASDLKKIIK